MTKRRYDDTPHQGEPMTYPSESQRARLELNARGHRPDPALERAADLFHTDRAAWNRLPLSVRSASSVYADLRQHHRDAVEAGVITPDDAA
jgi:hypothetical protein